MVYTKQGCERFCFLTHITCQQLVYGESNIALVYLQNQGYRKTSIKVITILTVEGMDRWQNDAMVLKVPDRNTSGITSTHILLTKMSHIDKPDISGRRGILLC